MSAFPSVKQTMEPTACVPEILEISKPSGHYQDQESGQLLIDKSVACKGLDGAVHMAKNSKEYYNLMYGDKDSYHLSFRSHNIPFHLVDFHPGIGGYLAPNPFHSGTSDFVGLGMIQRHPNNGSPLFLHSTLKEFEGADINNPHAFKRFTHFQVLDQKVDPL